MNGSPFGPRNDLVGFDETAVGAPFKEVAPKPVNESWAGNLIIASVKDQGPFLLEWIAYHRAIGFHQFLVFSHDCSDGTAKMLSHLEKTGIATHVNNDNWEGKSAQATALENIMQHPTVHASDWVVLIDTDEFINVRTGNGTFDCLVDALPQNVTNIAMTRRIFGSAGVVGFEDKPTFAQFERCAPSYLPKPHTAWGFKTATRNIDAYQSLSAHRPGSLPKELRKEVTWVNGSGQDITKARAKSGWRSDAKIIGYDLVQLNYYPLRSLETFLARQQAHVSNREDQGEDYWLRWDWSACQDITIQRNFERFTKEFDQLMGDKVLRKLHETTVQAHRDEIAKALEAPETQQLIDQIKALSFDDAARVAEILNRDNTAD